MRRYFNFSLFIAPLLATSFFTLSSCTPHRTTPHYKTQSFPARLARGENAEQLLRSSLLPPSFANKTLALVFWSPWCAVCVAEFPHLEQVKTELEEQNIYLVGISVGGTPSDIEHMKQTYRLTAPLLLDSNEQLSNYFGVKVIPTIVIRPADSNTAPERERRFESLAQITKLLTAER